MGVLAKIFQFLLIPLLGIWNFWVLLKVFSFKVHLVCTIGSSFTRYSICPTAVFSVFHFSCHFLLFHIFLFLLFSMVPYFKSFVSPINCFASKMLQFLDFLSNLLIKSKFILLRLNTLSLELIGNKIENQK